MEMQINYLAVLVAAIANFVLGALWYSQLLFAKLWMAYIGKTSDELRVNATPKIYGTAFLLIAAMCYVMAHFVNYVHAVTLWEGIQTGLWAWFGFVVTSAGIHSLFEGQPRGLFFINAGYQLAMFLVAGGLLAAWR